MPSVWLHQYASSFQPWWKDENSYIEGPSVQSEQLVYLNWRHLAEFDLGWLDLGGREGWWSSEIHRERERKTEASYISLEKHKWGYCLHAAISLVVCMWVESLFTCLFTSLTASLGSWCIMFKNHFYCKSMSKGKFIFYMLFNILKSRVCLVYFTWPCYVTK